MKTSNNRKLFNKYQIGNFLFKLLCAGFGALSFLYLSFTVQFFYDISPMHGTYYLFLTGSFLFIWGIIFRFFKQLNKFVSFPVFVYFGLGLFLLLYCGSILIHAYPSIATYLFIAIYLNLGVLLFLFLSLWRRQGGVAVFIYFAIGVLLSGIFNKIYSSHALYIVYATKIVFLLFCILIIAHYVGVFGIFKERRLSFVLSTLLTLVVIFYPLNLDTLIDELSRYRWQKTTQTLGTEYDYVDTYQTLSRRIDVFISSVNNSEEKYSFVENGTPVLYTYPLKEEHELSFYYSLVQQKAPLKSLLVMGDIPVGFINVLNKLPDDIHVDYVPIDNLYPAFWSSFVNDEMLSHINIINNERDMLPEYNIMYLFPPNIKGVGTFSYVNKSQFKMLRKHINTGSLIIVTSRLFPVGIENTVRHNLEGVFKNISFLKLTSDINFIIASDMADNITVDPSNLKYRFLELNIKGDYSKIKSYFENNKGIVSSYFGVMDDISSDKSSANKKFLLWSSILGVALFSIMYLFLRTRVVSVNTWIHSINTIVLFSMIGQLFSVVSLYHQKMFIDLHTTFSSLFSLLSLGITIGLITSWLLSRKITMERIFLWGLYCLTGLVFSWVMLMNYIFDARILMGYLVWTGLSSFILLGTIYWYRFFVSLDNIFRLLSLVFIGLSIGISLTGLFDLCGMDISIINYSTVVWVVIFVVYNMALLREKKL